MTGSKSESEVIKLAEDIGSLLYESEDQWSPLNLSSINREILEELNTLVEENESANILTPFYSPKNLVLYSIELLYQKMDSDLKVCIVTLGGQNCWGNRKADVYGELEKYGLNGSILGEPQPDSIIPDLFSVSSANQNGLTSYSESDTGNGEIVIAGGFKGLDKISSPDVVLVNAASKIQENWIELFEQYREEYNCPFYFFTGIYTKNESDNYPQFIPDKIPSLPIIPRNLELESSHEDFTDFKANLDFKNISNPGEVKIVGVGEDSLIQDLEKLNDISSELRQGKLPNLGDRILYKQLFLERAPVPLAKYDEWIDRERERSDNPYIPAKSRGKIMGLEQAKDDFEEAFVAGTINESIELLNSVREQILDSNPIYEAIKSDLNEDINSDRKAIVLVKSESLKSIFEYAIESESGVTSEELEDSNIKICRPSEARSESNIDRLYIPGSLHPRLKAFYSLPQADKIKIFTFGGRWGGMVKKHLDEYISDMNELFPGGDNFEAPKVSSEGRNIEIDEKDEKQDVGQTTLMKAFWRDYSGQESSQSDRRDDIKFKLNLEDNGKIQSRGSEKKLRKVDEDVLTEGKYTWTKTQNLSGGDRIVRIEDEFMEKLWRQELKEMDRDIDEDHELLEGVKRWYRSLEELLEEYNNYKEIYRKINEENDDISYSQVQSWLNSVKNANEPLNLIENPELTIGPRHAEHIDAVGKVFDLEELQGNSREIESTMKAFRVLNRRKGSNFRLKIVEKLSRGDEDIIEASSVASVKSVRELKQD